MSARALSQATLRNIRQNLFWASAYNVVLIPAAADALYPAFGLLLSPAFTAAVAGLSSVFVLAAYVGAGCLPTIPKQPLLLLQPLG